MRDVFLLLLHLLTTLAQLIRPGSSRAVIAENLLFSKRIEETKVSPALFTSR
jgi:hypothetical protein